MVETSVDLTVTFFRDRDRDRPAPRGGGRDEQALVGQLALWERRGISHALFCPLGNENI